MKVLFRVLCFNLIILTTNAVVAQDSMNMTLLGHWDWPETLSDVRCGVVNGHEYALVGSYSGFSIVDVSDPANMFEVGWWGGSESIWRDPFFYNNHAYCVTEGGDGLLIVDMNPLPNSTQLNHTYYFGTQYPFTAVHNMFIDENGMCYLFGTSAHNGVIMMDLSQDPMNPVDVGKWHYHYIHDGYVRGDTLWAGCLGDGMFALDVSDPSNITELANWPTVGNFAHNAWLSDDGDYIFTTDEITSGHVASYDVSDLSNVVELDIYNHPLSEEVIPHNAHYHNGWLVNSHYKDGVTIYDVHDPSNMVMTGYYDTYSSGGGNGFSGCWGVWPYLPSGNIVASDMQTGLYVFGHEYTRASYLEGNVTEIISGVPLSGVAVDIEALVPETDSDIFGNYATGTGNAGLYNVSFARAGYLPLTVEDVELISGETTVLDVELVPDTPFVFVGQVVDATTGDPITGTEVHLDNPFFQVQDVSDGNGIITSSTFYAGNYTVTAGYWGYQIFCEELGIGSNGDTLVISLNRGYEDNFELDLGWNIVGNASAGAWELGIPDGTEYEGEVCNPGEDSNDCGSAAYVTGNAGGEPGEDDVDDGYTRLRSPLMDLSDMVHPFVSFNHWFFNDGGNSGPNDEMTVSVDNGDSTVVLATYDENTNGWSSASFLLELFTEPTSTMRIIVETADDDPGHLVEAGFDNFLVWDEPNLVVEETSDFGFKLYPNPTDRSVFFIQLDQLLPDARVTVLDMSGRIVGTQQRLSQGINTIQAPEKSGVYLVEVVSSGRRKVERLVIQR